MTKKCPFLFIFYDVFLLVISLVLNIPIILKYDEKNTERQEKRSRGIKVVKYITNKRL